MRRAAGPVFLLASAAIVFAQAAGEANKAYKTPQGRAAMAAGLSAADRDARQRPRELVKAMGIRPGQTVVDLGSGPGYMLPFLSEAVGAKGRVVAQDIHGDFIERARARARDLRLSNVDFVLGGERDPHLPPGAADIILALDAYHHFDYPAEMLAAIQLALRPGGRLAIVEYFRRRGAMPGHPDFPFTHLRLDSAELVREVEAHGFRLLFLRDHVPGKQYLAMFAREG